jgi:hypothetical protein
MKRTPKILLTVICISASIASNAGNIAGRSTSVLGHMTVTLLTPAALIQSKEIKFSNISLTDSINQQTETGLIKVVGNIADFNVTVANRDMDINYGDTRIHLGDISTNSSSNSDGSNSINMGASISKASDGDLAMLQDESPLSVTINYN